MPFATGVARACPRRTGDGIAGDVQRDVRGDDAPAQPTSKQGTLGASASGASVGNNSNY